MKYDRLTQLARSALLILAYAEGEGLDREDLMRLAGLRPQDVADPDARIRTAAMVRLWRVIGDRLPHPDLGMRVGATVGAKQLGLVGYAMSYSSDLRSAMLRLARYARILSDAVQFGLDDVDGKVRVTALAHPTLVALRHPVDCGVTTIVKIAREITGTDLHPVAIDVPYAAPEAPTALEYRAAFGCTVNFDRPDTGIMFSEQQMSLPNRLADTTLTGYLDDLANIKLEALGDTAESLVNDLRQTLWTMLPDGRPDLWRAASAMSMSARTLQRRLGDEGTTFTRVLDDLRRDLSDELLSDRRLAVSEVAFLLGYSEPSAFQRAFRRWRGVSPRRFRTGSDG